MRTEKEKKEEIDRILARMKENPLDVNISATSASFLEVIHPEYKPHIKRIFDELELQARVITEANNRMFDLLEQVAENITEDDDDEPKVTLQ